jgi:hypothetical protein
VASTRTALTAQATTLAATPGLTGLSLAQIFSVQNFSEASLGVGILAFERHSFGCFKSRQRRCRTSEL